MIKISFAYKNKKFFDFQKKAKPVDTAKFEADKYTDVK